MPAGLHKASIGLLRFGSAALDAAVSASLRQHGCSVHPIDKADDLPSLPHDVLLLLLAERAAADAATLAKIDKCCARKLLIAPRERAFDARLTRSCDDFLLWPSPARELRIRIERLLSSRPQPAPLPAGIAADLAGLGLIGNSPSFIGTMDVVARFARSNVTVLIEGETGTGKELAARAVHYLGLRKGEPFVPLNCGALPDILLENELFGHRAGAFTDAKHDVEGLVGQANGGTLFFDEVDTLSAHGQVALLRFLQEGEYRPLGGTALRQSDVRVIAASNAPLEKLVADGRFRPDLFYRLNVARIAMPPLRERPGDARLLAEHFLAAAGLRDRSPQRRFGPACLLWIETYEWPGNVRELENFVERQLALTDGPVIEFGSEAGTAEAVASREPVPYKSARERAVRDFELDYLRRLMRRTGGNVTAAARLAHKERRAFGRLLGKHGIRRGEFAPRSAR